MIFQITASIAGFVIPMLVMSKYGIEVFGFSTSIISIVAGINILEIGLGSGFIQALFKPIMNNNSFEINYLLTNAKKYFVKSGIFILVGTFIVAVAYSTSSTSEIGFFELFFLAATLLFGAVFELVIIGKYRVLLTSDEKVGTLVNVQTGALIISSAVRIILMTLGFGVVIMQLIATVVYLLRVVIIKIIVAKKYPQLTFNLKVDSAHANTQKIENSAVILHNVSILVILNIPFLLLIMMTDLKTTSEFAVYAIVFYAVASILFATFSQAAVASFGKIAAKKDKNELISSFKVYEFIFSIILFSVYVSVLTLIQHFVFLYTNNNATPLAYLPLVAALFACAGVIYSFRVPMVTLIQADGHFKQTRGSVIIELVILVSTSIIGVKMFGIYGVFVGMILSAVYRAIHLIWYGNKKIIIQSSLLTVKRLLFNFAFGVIIYWVISYIQAPKIDSWLKFVGLALLQGTIILILFTAFNLIIEKEMFSELKKLFITTMMKSSKKPDVS